MRLLVLAAGLVFLASCAVPRGGDDAFVTEVTGTPGLTNTMTRYDLIQTGHGLCQVMEHEEFSRTDLITRLSWPNTKFEPDVTAVLLDAAHQELCPEYPIPRFTRN